MKDNEEKMKELLDKLDLVLRQQAAFSRKIDSIKKEVYELQYSKKASSEKKEIIEKNTPLVDPKPTKVILDESQKHPPIEQPLTVKATDKPKPALAKAAKKPQTKSSIEKFIGENLISKIGIIITIIGVGIGVQYSIEHDLINPMTRIILGYVLGLGLLGFGIKLKAKYPNYSAVLVSGAMAIMYFITFAAHSFYGLIPQTFAFALMVIFTIFTVLAAILYDKQVIALIGLVGAYTVPFLLSDGSGNMVILFTYMAIINAGILAIAVIKNWKPVYYAAFIITWMIFGYWLVEDSKPNEDFNTAMIFSSVFFVIFYIIFLAYKLIKKEKFNVLDVLIILANSFIFYGIGYVIMSSEYEQYLGLFTLANAIIHFIVSAIIYQQKLGNRNLFYMISGLVIVFITIAIPVQLDGNWVTLLWIGQAALLFWIGRTKDVPVYEALSYPLMAMAGISLFHDWSLATDFNIYGDVINVPTETPFFNIRFLSSLLFVGAVAFINFLDIGEKNPSRLFKDETLQKLISFGLRSALLLILFLSFCIEIDAYFEALYLASRVEIPNEYSNYNNYIFNEELRQFKVIWIINFSLVFLTILSFTNIKFAKDRVLGFINIALNTLGMFIFLGIGLLLISMLRENSINPVYPDYYEYGNQHIIIRYISIGFALALLATCYWYVKQEFMKLKLLKTGLELLISMSIIWILSSELLHWMDLSGSTESYKLGISIFWGICSLVLIAIGIWKNKIHLRAMAIILFAVTLVKLFLYDISHLNTISKTIVFISLGILLLIISFLYNKYKHIIADENPS